MNLSQYIIESERTVSDEFHPDKKGMRELHGAIGISTEISEIFEAMLKENVDVVNISEEVADVFWYIALLVREHGFILLPLNGDLVRNACKVLTMDLIIEAQIVSGDILDIYKKYSYYGRKIDKEKLFQCLYNLSMLMMEILDYIHVPLETALENNINKLKVRYPDKFESSYAIGRDIPMERNALRADI